MVEIDANAERVVDARSARRLVPLELADVAVPSASAGRGAPVLFFRVLGRESDTLRVELWERGEFHGARTLSGGGENPQLVARRVALAAAELGRRLSRRRSAALAREQRLRQSREAREREERERTPDGPFAVRSELAAGFVPGQLWVVGERLSAELTLHGRLRLDLGAELSGGSLEPKLLVQLQGVSAGPAFRQRLTRRLAADFGLRAAAFVVQVPGARVLDGIERQQASWTATLAMTSRLELGLTRQVRAALGVEAGRLLRGVPYASARDDERLHGVWLGASLGVVITPGAPSRKGNGPR